MLITILHKLDNFGCNHISGNTKGPAHKKAITIKDVLKYHFTAGSLFRNSPQKRHFTASSCISSAQNGHFFIGFNFTLTG
ncbi:MAG: hypothetical protein WCY05_03130 [Candidatus Omnitrophota bacterium]